jgi:hypothetical protein
VTRELLRKLRFGARLVDALVREALFSLRLWVPSLPGSLAGSIAEFVRTNAAYWSAAMPARPGILVEGHLAQYGPNYLLRTAVAAKALQEKTGLDIDVAFNGLSFQWVAAKRVYESFGIRNFLYLDRHDLLRNAARLFWGKVVARRICTRLRRPEDLLEVEYEGIRVGDLLYDDVLKLTGKGTIARIDGDVRRSIARSYYYYQQYRALFGARRYEYYVSTHTAYSQYGLLCRVALSRGVKVIETTDIQMTFFARIASDDLPTYHQGIRNSIARELGQAQAMPDALREAARSALQRRLNSQVNQIDVEKAYRGRVYDRSELRQALGLEGEGKLVFVLAHVFADAPHLSSGMLHPDYYQWLLSTLRACAGIPSVQWVVKPHPSASLYGEQGAVEKIVADLRAENVVACPADLNTRSLVECADALVTVHGTAGLEYACLGIPVLLAGRPFYSGFGFTAEPASVADYERELARLADVGRLTPEQMDRALEVYAIWDRQFDWNNPIITTEVLANVWGSGQPRDLERAYGLITHNLRACDPRKLKLWAFAQSVVE